MVLQVLSLFYFCRLDLQAGVLLHIQDLSRLLLNRCHNMYLLMRQADLILEEFVRDISRFFLRCFFVTSDKLTHLSGLPSSAKLSSAAEANIPAMFFINGLRSDAFFASFCSLRSTSLLSS